MLADQVIVLAGGVFLPLVLDDLSDHVGILVIPTKVPLQKKTKLTIRQIM